MGKAYNEIMDKIEVTPEMRQRVLQRIAAEDAVPARPNVPRFPKLKKYLPAAACIVLLITGAAVLTRLLTPAQPNPPPIVMVPPAVEEAASLQELSALVGFDVEVGFVLPFEPEKTTYCSYWRELAQIQYSGQGQTATYRQSVGTQDNSGDYNSYGDTVQIDAGGLAVTLKGQAGNYMLAIWTDGVFSYSLALSQGITETVWLTLLAQTPA